MIPRHAFRLPLTSLLVDERQEGRQRQSKTKKLDVGTQAPKGSEPANAIRGSGNGQELRLSAPVASGVDMDDPMPF